MSDKAIQQMEFRKRKAKEKIKELESLLNGRQNSFMEEIQDEAGVFSEEKLQSFIRELLGSLERYVQHKSQNQNYCLEEKEREFYTGYLYCTIRGMANNTYGPMLWIIPCKTYEDIINMAKDPETMRIHTQEELYYEELYEPETEGFFGYMDTVYELLTGENIGVTITEEQREKVYKAYPQTKEIDRERDKREDFEKSISEEEYDRAVDEWNESGFGAEEKEIDDFIGEIDEDRKKWAQDFIGVDSFCKHYKAYRENYFEVDRRNFVSNIEGMIDVFLLERGISCFGDKDRFLWAYTLVDQAYVRTKNMLRKGENLHV